MRSCVCLWSGWMFLIFQSYWIGSLPHMVIIFQDSNFTIGVTDKWAHKGKKHWVLISSPVHTHFLRYAQAMEVTEKVVFFKQGGDRLSETALANIFSVDFNTLWLWKHKYLLNPLCLCHFVMVAHVEECILWWYCYVNLSLSFPLSHVSKKKKSWDTVFMFSWFSFLFLAVELALSGCRPFRA